ncbi:hypothetical protein AWM68_14180 [Fictibacillus phosphorivorans]|uniref:DUF5658 domain-containing protein n=1 Tax=Fictibacillus phosphorivorans TaxID=1221500 RepID=A0A163PWJ3_9BACL|nr:DUF5658 family protein [Fictibacillus phosphorivorans]KZE64243.1 hypothetical protein AWM68_14180 [Fictibacillus phosphorivorans]
MVSDTWLTGHFWICVGIAVLNLLDAFVTHYLLMNGARELNPIMNALYRYHPLGFIGIKLFFSGIILVFGLLPVHPIAQKLTFGVFLVYSLVVLWQLYLFISF